MIEDDTGGPVLGRVEVGSKTVEFCSETDQPIRVRARQKIAISVVAGRCDDEASIVTEGTVTATFHGKQQTM